VVTNGLRYVRIQVTLGCSRENTNTNAGWSIIHRRMNFTKKDFQPSPPRRVEFCFKTGACSIKTVF
jgi:hypothetical protein